MTDSPFLSLREFIKSRGELSYDGGLVKPGQSRTWDCRLIIPVLAPRLTHCSLISLQYRLECEMELSHDPHKMVTSVPMIIGSIPLKADFPRLVAGTAGPMKDVPFPAEEYPDMPEPAFMPAEDVVGKLENGERFVPIYPAFATKPGAELPINKPLPKKGKKK